MEVARWILVVVAAYAAIGLVFGGAFIAWGVGRVDHAARNSRWTFRLLILPGVAAAWPMLLPRWIKAEGHA